MPDRVPENTTTYPVIYKAAVMDLVVTFSPDYNLVIIQANMPGKLMGWCPSYDPRQDSGCVTTHRA